MKLGLVYSRIRTDERMLLDAAAARGVEVVPLFDDEAVLDIHARPWDVDVVLERSISYYRGLYVLKFLAGHGTPAVNRYEVALRCGDKAETSLLLARSGVPTPPTRVAFTREAALKACAEVGYPAVLKPTMGSWARLLAKVDTPEQADMVLEHKEALANPLQQVYYIQRYVPKPAARDPVGENGKLAGAGTATHRDIRAFVVGDRTIAAIYRNSPHWITNTAQGGRASNCPVTPELDELCLKAAQAVGGGVLALDLMEDPTVPGGLTVHEVNHTMEFKNSVAPTGVDIPGQVIEFCVRQARR